MKRTFLCVLAILTIVGCGNRGGGLVKYTELHNYFVNNTGEGEIQQKITSQSEFDTIFGAAAFMGTDGEPTSVHSSKESVLAVAPSVTTSATTIEPVSLKQDNSGRLVFTYRTVTGEELDYSIHPCLLIKVPKSVKGTVVFENAEKSR